MPSGGLEILLTVFLPEGSLKDLFDDHRWCRVVIRISPNILILFFFISLMEDTDTWLEHLS